MAAIVIKFRQACRHFKACVPLSTLVSPLSQRRPHQRDVCSAAAFSFRSMGAFLSPYDFGNPVAFLHVHHIKATSQLTAILIRGGRSMGDEV